MARSKSSGRWLDEHFKDEYVQKAQREGKRSRAVYKLEQMDLKDKLIRPGMTVVDLGAAPGGWSQYAAQKVGRNGRVLASDILPMDTIADVDFVLGDFRDPGPLAELEALLKNQQVDLVLSDMAPNMTGTASIDQPSSMYLIELALEFANAQLKPGGDMLTKAFQGEGFDEYLAKLRKHFKKVQSRKPDASRSRSREVYLLARGWRG